jgi:hypothetical protein
VGTALAEPTPLLTLPPPSAPSLPPQAISRAVPTIIRRMCMAPS